MLHMLAGMSAIESNGTFFRVTVRRSGLWYPCLEEPVKEVLDRSGLGVEGGRSFAQAKERGSVGCYRTRSHTPCFGSKEAPREGLGWEWSSASPAVLVWLALRSVLTLDVESSVGQQHVLHRVKQQFSAPRGYNLAISCCSGAEQVLSVDMVHDPPEQEGKTSA